MPPYSAIGISITDLGSISIFWRQLIEPNETSYVAFRIFQLKPPFPLTLLTLFSLFGIMLADAANNAMKASQRESANKLRELESTLDALSNRLEYLDPTLSDGVAEEKRQSLIDLLDPFRLTARLSIFYPITKYTAIGFLTIDFRHVEYSIEQLLEPNGNLVSIFRFLDFYAPLSLQIATMSLSVGLFITGLIYKHGLQARENVIQKMKETLNR